MAEYQLTQNPEMILRTADGAWIPTDTGNRDYRAYLEWLLAGNEPDAADPIPVPDP